VVVDKGTNAISLRIASAGRSDVSTRGHAPTPLIHRQPIATGQPRPAARAPLLGWAPPTVSMGDPVRTPGRVNGPRADDARHHR
jgi:hypothetical protein